ncbi:hypothetical protein D4764_05G0006740 [Takifugu flavidus]|uniref:Uncharacterized protein n=1 Tax=Takifugu flavidus TaxID=433684 RepID=A0A5C6MYZ8_9TELE|nr:hypothetical protein D4764_05G0006740 [Takifugu flavidus]
MWRSVLPSNDVPPPSTADPPQPWSRWRILSTASFTSITSPSWSLFNRRILGQEWTDGGHVLQFWQSPCSSLLKGANGSSAPGLLPSYSHLHISCCTGLSPGVSSTFSPLCWETQQTFWPQRVRRRCTIRATSVGCRYHLTLTSIGEGAWKNVKLEPARRDEERKRLHGHHL